MRDLLDRAVEGATLEIDYGSSPGFFSRLERELPAILSGVYPFWRGESLDSFRIGLASKTGPRSAELVGLALTLSDQAWIAFRMQLRFEAAGEELEWLHVWIGEADDGGEMSRLPYGASNQDKLLRRVLRDRDELDWVHEAVLGEP